MVSQGTVLAVAPALRLEMSRKKKPVAVTVNGDPGCWLSEDERKRWMATSGLRKYLLESPPERNLKSLVLECSGVDHVHMFPNQELKAACLAPFSLLEELKLQSCSLRVLALPELPSLRTLNISNNHIQTLRHIGTMESLGTLDVSYNELGGWDREDTAAAAAECEALIAHLMSLEVINLRGNRNLVVETMCESGLCTLQELEQVDIRETMDELTGYKGLKAGLARVGRERDVEILASREIESEWKRGIDFEPLQGRLGKPPSGVATVPGRGPKPEPEPEPLDGSRPAEPEPVPDDGSTDMPVDGGTGFLNEPGKWDVMISYTQRNAKAQMLAEKLYASLVKKRRTVWLDVQMAQLNEAAMQEAAQNSGCVVAIVTGPCISAKDVNVKSLDALDVSTMDKPEENAYFARKFCLMELRWACAAGRPIQPVVQREDKEVVGDLIAQLPQDLQQLSDIDFKSLDTHSPPFWDLSVKELLKSVVVLTAAASPLMSIEDLTPATSPSGGASSFTPMQRLQCERSAMKRDIEILQKERASQDALLEKLKTENAIARELIRKEQQAREQEKKAWDREQDVIKQRARKALQQVAEAAGHERAQLQQRAEAAEQQADTAAAAARQAQTDYELAAQQMDVERSDLKQEAEEARKRADAAKKRVDEAKAAESAAKAELEKKLQLVQVPTYWTNKDPESPTQLHPAQEMVQILEQAMNKSIMQTCGGCNVRNGVRVCGVTRVENMALWRQYRCFQLSIRDRLREKPTSVDQLAADASLAGSWFLSTNPGNGPRVIDTHLNEFWLWHGTSEQVAEILAESGFDERVANMAGLYGAGSYFADAMCKSHQYTQPNAQGEHCMLYCRVIMGSAFRTARGHQNERRPPANTADPRPGASFDSIFAQNRVGRGGHQIHNEFVVFRDYQVYPEFIIRYTRK